MRASVITCLILIALVGLGLRGTMPLAPPAPVAFAQSNGPPPLAPLPPPPEVGQKATKPISTKPNAQQPLKEMKVESDLHAQVEDALNDALGKAATQLHVYLLSRTPPIEWKPTPEFVRSKLVKQPDDQVVKSDVIEGMPEMHQISLYLVITPEDMKQIRQEDHKFRVEQRLWTAGRGLGGLVILLGALAGYMRLDELTKGYFTFPLRLGALALGVAGAAAVWFVV